MALRTIVINLAVAQAQGQPMAQEKIQADRLRRYGAIPPDGGANRRSRKARKQRSEKTSGDGQR